MHIKEQTHPQRVALPKLQEKIFSLTDYQTEGWTPPRVCYICLQGHKILENSEQNTYPPSVWNFCVDLMLISACTVSTYEGIQGINLEHLICPSISRIIWSKSRSVLSCQLRSCFSNSLMAVTAKSDACKRQREIVKMEVTDAKMLCVQVVNVRAWSLSYLNLPRFLAV